jgi:hypothetical protein
MLDAMARLEPERVPLSQTIDRLLLDARRATHLVLVTPYIDEPTSARLRILIERGGSLVVAAIVDEDRNPPWLHRVAILGCQVVEIRAGAPLSSAFSYGAGAGVRRH